MNIYATLALLATTALAVDVSTLSQTSVIAPVYIYPDTGASAWAGLFSAIQANPSVHFYCIVNVDSGPGADEYPDSNFIFGNNKLNSIPSVTTLGYVHVSYGERPIAEVKAEIDAYKNWDTYTQSNISMNGIFFDEVPNDGSSTLVNYMAAASTYAKTAFPAGRNFVTFNPGTTTDPAYFAWANAIVIYEDAFSNFNANVFSTQTGGTARQKAAIIHTFSGTTAALQTVVNSVVAKQAGPLFITQDAGYKSWASYFSTEAKDIAAANAA